MYPLKNRLTLSAIIIFSGLSILGFKVLVSDQNDQKNIQGVSTESRSEPINPTPSDSPTPTITIPPTLEAVKNTQVVYKDKQYGGWYWRPDLNKAQIWIGTDSAGKDIWSDTGDPTPTPIKPSTPSTSGSETKINEIQFGVATDSQMSTPTPTPSNPGAAGSSGVETASTGTVSTSVSQSIREVNVKKTQ